MSSRRAIILGLTVSIIGLSACQQTKSHRGPAFASAEIRGEYLVKVLGCSSCHTDGALTGEPQGEWLAGSSIGIVYAQDPLGLAPALAFPSNLTSDEKTGLGGRSLDEIVAVLRSGMNHTGEATLPIMPWTTYRLLHMNDLEDIASYLLSLPPIEHETPSRTLVGDPVAHPFVRIGVFGSISN